MKIILPSLFALALLAACQSESNDTSDSKSAESSEKIDDKAQSDTEDGAVQYDAELAQKLGADDYGMKQYVMTFLYAGPNRDQDSAEVAEIQRGHLDNIGRLDSLGKLVLAGPFMDGSDLRGIFVFDVKTVEEAEALTATDPAIQTGRLRVEFKPWYGSAAVSQIGEVHRTIAKQNP